MRADLLALTEDDLVALANRGNVKRARQEVESLTVELAEDDDGTVTARWSDAAACTIPAGKSLAAGRCTCPAPPPCRHLLRTVFAYQSQAPAPTGAEAPPPAPWDPGAIADDALAAVAAKTALTRAARWTGDGQVFELVRALRPVARCHSAGVTVRFLVPDAPAYAVCDCGQPAPCEHAVAAIQAFRRLPEGASAGLIECGTTPPLTAAESDALAAADAAVVELARVGLADAPAPLLDRLRRAEDALRRRDLVWPADLLTDLLLLQDAYIRRDARFAPDALARAVGEWAARHDALRSATGAVPQLFVRGSAQDRTVEIASTRLVGLGCAATPLPRGVRLTALLQEESSGHTVAVVREFADDGRDFAALANGSVGRGVTLAGLGRSNLLVKGGKRNPNGAFSFGRAPLSALPQAFAWEKLRAPLLADGFAEVAARLSALPPVALRPRRLGEGLHVVPVASVDGFGFDAADQVTFARLRDPEGGEALLVHPFRSAAAGGTAALLTALESGRVAFVAGRFRAGPGGFVVEPVGVVVAEGDGARRLVQPHIDMGAGGATGGASMAASAPLTPARVLGEDLPALLGEWLTVGVEASGDREARRALELGRTARAVGLVRTAAALERLAQAPTPGTLLELAALAALFRE